jgi:hypothetical protein
MPKVYETAGDLPGRYRQIAEYFANPHSLMYACLDVFRDFLVRCRQADVDQAHNTATDCGCWVCAAKAGRPTFVLPLNTRQPDPDWVLWGDGHYVATDMCGRRVTRETPCVGKAQGGCPCYWCRPYHYDASITNRQALHELMGFIAPLVVAARGVRLEREKAALQARLAAVERELGSQTYQIGLM